MFRNGCQRIKNTGIISTSENANLKGETGRGSWIGGITVKMLKYGGEGEINLQCTWHVWLCERRQIRVPREWVKPKAVALYYSIREERGNAVSIWIWVYEVFCIIFKNLNWKNIESEHRISKKHRGFGKGNTVIDFRLTLRMYPI